MVVSNFQPFYMHDTTTRVRSVKFHNDRLVKNKFTTRRSYHDSGWGWNIVNGTGPVCFWFGDTSQPNQWPTMLLIKYREGLFRESSHIKWPRSQLNFQVPVSHIYGTQALWSLLRPQMSRWSDTMMTTRIDMCLTKCFWLPMVSNDILIKRYFVQYALKIPRQLEEPRMWTFNHLTNHSSLDLVDQGVTRMQSRGTAIDIRDVNNHRNI